MNVTQFRQNMLDDFKQTFDEVMQKGFPRRANYIDVGYFLSTSIKLGLHKSVPCPALPFHGLIDRRQNYSPMQFWLLARSLCHMYEYLYAVNRNCRTDGTLHRLYNDRLIQPEGNNFQALRDTAMSWKCQPTC